MVPLRLDEPVTANKVFQMLTSYATFMDSEVALAGVGGEAADLTLVLIAVAATAIYLTRRTARRGKPSTTG